MPDLDDTNNDGVVQENTETSVTLTAATSGEKQPVTVPVKKLELTPEELDAIKAEAVAQAQEEHAERIRREEAERQGNYKALFEQAEADKKEANLQLWRQKALNKFKLSEDLEDMLTGETEEELMKAAKKLHTTITREVEAKLKAETVAPPDPGRTDPPRQRTANSDETVRRTMKTALNIGRVLH